MYVSPATTFPREFVRGEEGTMRTCVIESEHTLFDVEWREGEGARYSGH